VNSATWFFCPGIAYGSQTSSSSSCVGRSHCHNLMDSASAYHSNGSNTHVVASPRTHRQFDSHFSLCFGLLRIRIIKLHVLPFLARNHPFSPRPIRTLDADSHNGLVQQVLHSLGPAQMNSASSSGCYQQRNSI